MHFYGDGRNRKAVQSASVHIVGPKIYDEEIDSTWRRGRPDIAIYHEEFSRSESGGSDYPEADRAGHMVIDDHKWICCCGNSRQSGIPIRHTGRQLNSRIDCPDSKCS